MNLITFLSHTHTLTHAHIYVCGWVGVERERESKFDLLDFFKVRGHFNFCISRADCILNKLQQMLV